MALKMFQLIPSQNSKIFSFIESSKLNWYLKIKSISFNCLRHFAGHIDTHWDDSSGCLFNGSTQTILISLTFLFRLGFFLLLFFVRFYSPNSFVLTRCLTGHRNKNNRTLGKSTLKCHWGLSAGILMHINWGPIKGDLFWWIHHNEYYNHHINAVGGWHTCTVNGIPVQFSHAACK